MKWVWGLMLDFIGLLGGDCFYFEDLGNGFCFLGILVAEMASLFGNG